MLDGGGTQWDVVLGDWEETTNGIDVTPRPNPINDLAAWTEDVRAVERTAELCSDARVVLDDELLICWLSCGNAERAKEIYRYLDARAEELGLRAEDPSGTDHVCVRHHDFSGERKRLFRPSQQAKNGCECGVHNTDYVHLEETVTSDLVVQQTDGWRTYWLGKKDCYSGQAKVFVQFLDGELDGKRRDISLATLEEYAAWMKDRKTRLGTFNLRLSAAKARLRDLFNRSPAGLDIAKRHLFDEALKSVRPMKRQNRRVSADAIPTWEEVQQVIQRTKSPRTKLFIEFLATTGCRVSEMTGARWDHARPLDQDHWEIEVLGKGAKVRKVWVKADLVDRIRGEFAGKLFLFETINGNTYGRTHVSDEVARVFGRMLGAGKRRGRAALRPRVSAHKLRHVFATTAVRRGMGANGLRDYLGHADVSTTLQMYVHDGASWQDVRRVIE